MAAPSSAGSQSSEVQVQSIEVNVGLDESECDMSERARAESSRAYLMDLRVDGSSRRIIEGPEHLETEMRKRVINGSARLLVVHGLPVDYLELLREISWVEADVVDSMSRRRPSRNPWKDEYVLCYEYPEQMVGKRYDALVSSRDLNLRKSSPLLDLLDGPPQYSIPESNCQVAICRATLRVCQEERHVLFLDRCLWRDASHLGKGVDGSFVTKPCACNNNAAHGWDLDGATRSEEEASLEHRIWEHLNKTRIWETPISAGLIPKAARLQACFAQCVYASWAELLESLTLEGDMRKYMNLLQQIQRSLERNIDAEKAIPGQKFTGPDWRELLERVERRVRLASQLSPAAVIQMPTAASEQPPGIPPAAVEEVVGSKPKEEAPSPEAEENKRSLDRVAYLGGVLLPMTIVSGILAMGDTFGPTGDMFYVFWATAVPLTLLTLAIIYADSIRRVEVWIAEAQSTYDAQTAAAAAASGGLLGKMKKKPLLQPGAAATPDLEQAVPYSETVTIDYGVPETATTRIGEPVTYMAEEPVIAGQPGEQNGGDGSVPLVWKKEELGWLGACKTILGIYKLQDMKKRPWHHHSHTHTKKTTTTLN
ncbi:hypothetical protein PG993_007672 [Apiospora rasikravindrae]|uniref:Uncharacterized protein n=1 Tax=Apiospora rasikravindrae TaxID=990691 RepID=A0ABR1SZK0_9PEZI